MPYTKKTNPNKKRFNNKRRYTALERRNYNTLKSLKGNYKGKLNLSLELKDGSTKVLPINDSFFYSVKNKLLTKIEIIEKLNTIKHDFHAENYTINKLIN